LVRALRVFLVLVAALALQALPARSAQPPAQQSGAAAANSHAALPPPDDADDVLTIQGARLSADVAPVSYDITIQPDAAQLTTKGSVKIQIDVKRPTRTISLNAYQLDLTRATLDDAPARISLDTAAQTATFSLAQEVRPGRHQLTIDFVGGIVRSAYGLFAVDYRAPDGTPARLLATQFESTAAHRFIPCWDAPAAKAVFTLHVIAPANRMVVSNTPAQRTRPLSGDKQQVDFAPTPKMSPYLLFLSIGDYERIHRVVDGVDAGVIMRRGQVEQGRFALESAAEILSYYNRYFGVKYPLPKMDMIGAPVTSNSFAAMENWGALFYLERAILIPPGMIDENQRKQYVFNVVAHEMAHQWFGDLVTMRDWNELWLNEGFANWMAAKAAETLHPNWQSQVQELSGREAAMRIDARPDAPPIVARSDLASSAEIPTSITYGKGEYVVRMVEAYLGEDVFRDGIRRYIRQHQYANTTSDDLWSALKAASRVDVGSFAHGFTDQPGIPLIRAETAPDGLRLSQARFGINEQARATMVWQTPVSYAEAGAATVQRRAVAAGAPVTLAAAPGTPLLLNAGQTAYLRVDYDEASFTAVRGAFGKLAPIDQLGLLNDQWALAVAGYRPLSQWLSLLRQMPADASPVVWAEVIERLNSFDAYYGTGPQHGEFQAAVLALTGPQTARVGAVARPGEDPNIATLRGQLGLLNDHFAYPRAVAPRTAPARAPFNQLDQVDVWATARSAP
jgi:aminopeptidase N